MAEFFQSPEPKHVNEMESKPPIETQRESIETDVSETQRKEVHKHIELIKDSETAISALAKALQIPEPESIIDNIKIQCQEKQINLDLDESIKTIILFKDRFHGFEGSEETKDIINNILISIAGKKYFKPEVLGTLIDKIEFRKHPEKSSKFSKVEDNILVVFDNFGTTNESFSKLEFCILHEIGHIIGFSELLGEDQSLFDEGLSEDNIGAGNNNIEIDSLISNIDISYQDLYSQNCERNGENPVEEIKASLIGIWAKYQNNPEGFIIERFERTNSDAINKLFKCKDKELIRLFHSAKNSNSIETLKKKVNPEFLEMFNKIVTNSQEIFELINTKWREAEQDNTLHEKLQAIHGLDTNEYFDFSEENIGFSGGGESGDTTNLTGPSANKDKSHSPTANQSNVNATSLGNVLASTGELIKAFGSDLDFITPR